ncbi:DUF2291 domain-containing protein [Pararhodonellum marinum]|uniref:DUF2291 domain-containing protein n=1 Tax=Pararhodonellum marinum TaxID=2755358 RepID=UPI00188DE0F3|nr:DUF2291 domain-containing protein [Pararhodonellum marinum]
MKKLIRIIIFIGMLFLLVYSSVTIQPLSEYKKASSQPAFDAQAYAEAYWDSTILPGLDSGVDLEYFLRIVQEDSEGAFKQYGNAISIGNIRYFLVKAQGRIGAIDENAIAVQLVNVDGADKVMLAVEFIYGNAARDVFGAIDINEFESTAALNKVSEEINKLIRAQVVTPFLQNIQEGDLIEIIGVLEMNQKFLALDNLELIPLKLSIAS